MVTKNNNSKISLILILVVIMITMIEKSYSLGCTSSTCVLESGGICLDSGDCICGSTYIPSTDLSSCNIVPSCVAANFSVGANNTQFNYFQPTFSSNFDVGRWSLSFQLPSIDNSRRNIVIYNPYTSQLCANFTEELDSGSSNDTWSQSVNSTNAPNCFDVLSGGLYWSNISNCMRNASNSNLYEAKVVVETTILSVQQNQGGLQRSNNKNNNIKKINKRDDSSFTYERMVSFNFQASVSATSNITQFFLDDQIAVFFKILSTNFDVGSLQLTVVIQQSITDPIAAKTTGASLSGTSIPSTITVGNDTCGSLCNQIITIVFDMTNQSCSGISGNIVLDLQPICKTIGSLLCPSLLTQIGSKQILIPFTISAEWCPSQQSTQLQVTDFSIYANGQIVNNNDVVTSTRNMTGNITVSILSQPTGSVLSSAIIDSLSITDGTNTISIVSGSPYSNANFFQVGTNIYVSFYYIVPRITLDFTKSLTFNGDVNVLFEVPNSKRSISLKSKFNSLRSSSLSYNLNAESSSFIVSQPTTSITTSNSPSTTSSNQSPSSSSNSNSGISTSTVIGIIVGVVGGVLVVVGILIISLFIRKNLLKNKNSSDSDVIIDVTEKKGSIDI
jgi:hypothetical protein